jgi:hypothetical protein
MTMKHAVRRLVVRAGAAVLMLGLALPALAVPVAYFTASAGTAYPVLIDWQDAARARVVNYLGAQSGAVTGDAAQRVITLDSPISYTTYSAEQYCVDGIQEMQRVDTTQLVVRDVTGLADQGTSQMVEIGTVTTLDGCRAGLVVPFGSIADTGLTVNRLAMSARPSVKDLKPGTRIAGFSEQVWVPGAFGSIGADVVTLFAGGTASFAATGHVVPAALNAENWLVFDFGSFARAYTRLAVDTSTGAETWLRAEWAGGQAQRVMEELVVKPAAPADFGTERQASRMWESGMFADDAQVHLFSYLYQGGTGERVTMDLVAGTESRVPITWAFAGSSIVQTRFVGTTRVDRTWVPLRNIKGKLVFVMENEIRTYADGSTHTYIPPRVNFVIDTGKAVP